MAGPGHATAYGVVADGWNPFVLSAATPTFEWVNNENAPGDPVMGSQYIWADLVGFDAGIDQTITGLTPGVYYRFWLGYALAAYDPGDQINHRNNLIGRQVGIDLTGGTDPRSPTVAWGTIYWDGNAALNIPALSMTFAAQSSRATIFLRVVNTNINNGRSKVWFDAVCMEMLNPQPSPVPSTVFLPFVRVNSIACTPLTTVATIPVGVHPKGVAVDPPTNRVFVSLFDSSAVAVVDAATNQVLATWSTNSSGHSNGVSVSGGNIYVALRDAASVAVLNASTGAFVANRSVGSQPYGVGATGSRVWVANFASNSVSILDAATTNGVTTTNAGSNPSLVAPAASSAFVSDLGDGVMEVANDGTLLHNFTATGAGSFGIAFNAATNQVYVSNRNTSQVAALDATTGAVVKSVTLAQVPYALAFESNRNHLFVVLAESNQLAILDGATLNSIAVVSIGAQGAQGGDGIALMNNRVYVVNNDAGTMSVIQDACP
jgi:YVTN family beta-propeller protein